jgi:tetratricopeptide (TPR) repeat protein
MPLDLAQAVVLCGAGISVEAPSDLPSGDALALRTFDLAANTGAHPYDAGAVARVRDLIRSGELRLEVICDLLARELPPATVISPFEIVCDALTNRMHVTIALLAPIAVVTTNQDLLLERAAALVGNDLPVVHLHGRCDQPDSIITTIGGYLQGLSELAEQELAALVEGRDLVVLGYSGRDLDVMNALTKANPRHIVWIEHGKRRMPVELPPELLATERLFGRSWERLARDTGSWLYGLLHRDQREACAKALAKDIAFKHGRGSTAHLAGARFAQVEAVLCALALGHVLRHAGLHAEARAGYTRLRRERPNDLRVALAWAEATFELNDFDDAIEVFREVRTEDSDADRQARAVLGEVEALRDRSRFDEARVVLDALGPVSSLIHQPSRRAAVRAAGGLQRGGMARMDGDLDVADSAYEDALRDATAVGDVRGALEARTWRTEILLARGFYAEALAASTATLGYAPFANARWLSWAEFVHCEALCAAGERVVGLDRFRRVLDAFSRYGNPQGEVWTLVAEASFRRIGDAIKARRALAEARRTTKRLRTPLAYASARMLWEEAEVERADGRIDAARERLNEFRRHVGRTFPSGHPWLTAHGDALEAELAREGREADTAELAARAKAVETAYRSLGAEGAARRMQVSRWALTAADPGERLAGVARDWQRLGYAPEAEASLRLTQGSYAPLNVWFVP